MCRLFGFRSNVPSRAHRSLIEAENALARQACNHRDGWGIGYFLNDDAYVFRTEGGAADDERFKRISERLRSHTFLVHVRRATVGQVDSLNSHPFRHGRWLFAHNGTIFGFERLQERMLAATDPSLSALIFGATDSEHVFYYLLSALLHGGQPVEGRGEACAYTASALLRDAVGQLFRWAEELGLEPPKLNFILTNGTVFFAQRAGLELYLATQKHHCQDFATCQEPNKVCMMASWPALASLRPRMAGVSDGRASRRCNHLLIASEPIGSEDIWEEVPDGWMVVLDEDFHLRMQPPPEHFRVTWPEPLQPPAPRAGVIAATG